MITIEQEIKNSLYHNAKLFLKAGIGKGTWGRLDCPSCGSHDSVIYDKLNIHIPYNKHQMPGLYQISEDKFTIYECPECGKPHIVGLKNPEEKHCQDGFCAFSEITSNTLE